MKRIYFIVLFFCISSISLAKDPNVMLSADLGYYIPIGGGSRTYEGNIGFQGQIEIRTNDYTGIDFTLGYLPWPGSTKDIISLMIGTRFYWFKKGPTPYTGLVIGIFSYKNQYYYGGTQSYSKFGFSIFQGALLPLISNFYYNCNIELTYFQNIISPYSFITINTGMSYLF